MKLPINWLKDYVEVPMDPQELIDQMTEIGHMQDGFPKEVAGDTVYDLEIRQNRSDCLSLIGLAREAAAVQNVKVNYPESYSKLLPQLPSNLEVEIQNPQLCYRFNVVRIDNVKIAPSPEWLVKKLESYGVKSINNVVDITNFVMIETGEPMHAYDARAVAGKMVIRTAKKGEKLSVLGAKELTLTDQDLLITDNDKILSLAGIIGGEKTGIQNDTTSIILEDATYNQAAIRRTSIRHMVRTEASTRHEKFLHPHLTTIALQRAVKMIQDLAGGTLVDHTDVYPEPMKEKKLTLRVDHLQELGGVDIDAQEAQTILMKLEIPTEIQDDNTLSSTIPYFRTDLQQEADLIEEVLRMYGYENIPDRLLETPPPKDIQSYQYAGEERIRDIMVAAGYDEQITEPLTKEEKPYAQPVYLENSLNNDKTMLRTTLKYSLQEVLQQQLKYRKTDVRIFEIGKTYFQEKDEYHEEKKLGLLSQFSGNSYAHIKGVFELLQDRLGAQLPEEHVHFEQVDSTTWYCEIDLGALIAHANTFRPKLYTTPPQIILQDFSLSAPADTKVGDIVEAMKKHSHLVYKITLGEQPHMLKNGQKTLFLHVSFHSPSKTITNEDVLQERQQILTFLHEKYSVTLRS